MECKMWELHLGRPGKLAKWTDYGAGRRRVCPQVPPGLPVWKHLALDSKLPFVNAPGNVYISRGYAGEKLLSGKRAHDFRLFDAYCRELDTPYESLHDGYLKKHLKKNEVVACLQHTHRINHNNEALSSLKKLNKFREMTRLMNLDHVHYQMNLETKAVKDERRLLQIEDMFKETQHNWEMEQKFKDLREMNQVELKKTAEKTFERWNKQKLKKEKQVEILRQTLYEKQQSRKMDNAGVVMKVEKNLEQNTLSQRAKLLGLKRKIRERDVLLNTRKNEKLLNDAQQKIEQVKVKWESKCAALAELNKKTKLITANVMETHQANIEKRKKKAAWVKRNQEELRFQRLLARREKLSENYVEKKEKKTTKNDDQLGLIPYMINFLIDAAVIKWTVKIITPLVNDTNRLAITHGFCKLNELRMNRSKSNFIKFQVPVTKLLDLGDKEEILKRERQSSYPQNVKPTQLAFPEKNKLEAKCHEVMFRLLSCSKLIIRDCVEPITRARTTKILTKYEHRADKLINILAIGIYREDLAAEALAAIGIARAAIIAIMNPPEWRKPKSKLVEMRRLIRPA